MPKLLKVFVEGVGKVAFPEGTPENIIRDAMTKHLDMTKQGRLERSTEFFPKNLYHGTSTHKSKGEIFDEFQLFEGDDLSRSVSRSPVGKLGVSLGETPGVAEEFARMASPVGGEGATILPVRFRAKNVASLKLAGDETNSDIFSTVLEAWKDGHDAIHFQNYTTPSGKTGQSFVLVKDPNQIRSPHAAFDPKKRDSADILAGLAAGGVGIGALSTPDKAQADDLPKNLTQINQDYGSIQGAKHPALMELSNLLRKPTIGPLGPVLSGLPDLLEKYAYGDERSVTDYIKASLDFL